jgi:HK97 family phage prohead protease
MDLERRHVTDIRTSGRTLHGLAAPFGKAADIGGMFRETIAAGAFAATIARDDIRALADHRADALLARTRSGTLRLTETPDGLQYAIDVPQTTLGNDLLTLATRGDLSGVSIGFVATDESWPDPRARQLRAVTLHEISVITGGTPAYDGTSVAVRHLAAGSYLRRVRLLELSAWAD